MLTGIAEYSGKKFKVYRKCDEKVSKVCAIYFQSKLKLRNKHRYHENLHISANNFQTLGFSSHYLMDYYKMELKESTPRLSSLM